MDRDAPNGKRVAALWGYLGVTGGEEMAAYLFTSSGKKVGQHPGEMGPHDVLALRQGLTVAQREGRTVADASNLFDARFEREDLIECCNMHARRYFRKALNAGDARATLPLAGSKKLYEIEAEIRDRE